MTGVELNLVVIRAKDIDRAAAFYSLLGLQFKKHRHGKGPEHYASDIGGTVFEIYPHQEEEGGSTGTRIGFKVPSVDAAVAALKKAGAHVVSSPKDSIWGRRAVIVDFDGHLVELTERLTPR